MPKTWLRALVMVLATAFFVIGQETWALAAATTGTISGTVTDDAGHPLAGVSVSAVAPSQTSHSVTGSNGFYSMTGLAPDTYLVSFTRQGYQTQQIQGVTLVQGQSANVSVALHSGLTVLGHVTVRGVTSVVQPHTTADQYTVTTQTVQQVTGTPQNISETALLDSLPGITTDVDGYPIIRGGAENEEGYELEGVDATDPITGQFINSLSLAGESRVVVSTGGYDVSAGNTNAGVVNEVIKRGTYPGSGEMTATVNAPNFDHRLAMEYGDATPDNKFSYFFGFNSLRQFRVYGDTKTFQPELVGAVGDASGNIDVSNLFYRWGSDNRNELEYMGETGASLFQFDNGVNPLLTPYATNNPIVQATLGSLTNQLTLFPGQTAYDENTGYPDNENNVHTIEKLNYKRQFSSSSFGDFTLFRTIESDVFLLPWNGGAFGDDFEYNVNTNYGVQVDYTDQINSDNLASAGGATIDTAAKYRNGEPSFEPFIFSGVDPLTNLFPNTTGEVNDGLHRSNFWLQDVWTPTARWNINPGLRWDQEILDLPANAASQDLTLVNEGGTFAELPGQPITSAVTRPDQVSPRLAASYDVNPDNVIRFSYGKNIEFTPFSNIEFKWDGDPALQGVPLPSTLPGYSPTCSLGKDPANGNAACNGIANYYQLFRDEYNTSFFDQYTPVQPQTATNTDISWEHQFGGGFQFKLTPYYRKGVDYVVESSPLLFTLPSGQPIFGAPREENAGINENTGVEAIIQKTASAGWSGFVDATYDNTLANYNSDFFPSVNNAALALNHFFHVSYLAPITGNININYDQPRGWHISNELQYESGYRYGVGKDTFVYESNCIPGAPSKPIEVLNTDLADACLGLSGAQDAYYFTDPTDPGTILHPNITGSRGTPDGSDPGTLHGPQVMTWLISIAHDIGSGPNPVQAGVRVSNVLGNYSQGLIGSDFLYSNNGFGGFGPNSGHNGNIGFEPYQYNRTPLPYETYPVGSARTFSFFLSSKI